MSPRPATVSCVPRESLWERNTQEDVRLMSQTRVGGWKSASLPEVKRLDGLMGSTLRMRTAIAVERSPCARRGAEG